MAQGKNELTDQELEQAVGAQNISDSTSKYVSNSNGDYVGFYWDNRIMYYPCEKCGKPTHQGFFCWFCDPCDKQYWNPASQIWNGSAEALKAASL